MKNTLICLILLVCACSAIGQTEKDADAAGDVYTSSQIKNPFVDKVARQVGDILTVLIVENSSSVHAASTSLNKADTNSVTNGIPILQGLFQLASNSAASSNSGSGSTSNTGKLTAEMAVKVVKVLPNGVLQIEGTRSIKTNRDSQNFILTGEVRPEDVLTNNTVLSQNIEDAKIVIDDKGAIAIRQRRGILTRIIDWLF